MLNIKPAPAGRQPDRTDVPDFGLIGTILDELHHDELIDRRTERLPLDRTARLRPGGHVAGNARPVSAQITLHPRPDSPTQSIPPSHGGFVV